jgi:hypothetical protein
VGKSCGMRGHYWQKYTWLAHFPASRIAVSGMRRIFSWLKTRFETFALLPDYGKATAKQWMNILFGETVLGAVFLIWWALTNPKNPPLILIFVAAAILAGYFVWRADHVRLVPKFRLGDVGLRWVGMASTSTERRRYVYLQVECETEGEVKNCRGQLLRVSRWSSSPTDGAGRWEVTHLNETLDLLWSYVDKTHVDLEYGAARQLNIFYVHNRDRRMVTCAQYNPNLETIPSERFKFDVRVAGDECLPRCTSIEVTVGDDWYELEIDKNET